MMNFHVMTLFPDMINNAMAESITGRAIKAGHITVNAVNIRDFAGNKHNSVDDYPMAEVQEWLCRRHRFTDVIRR